MYKYNLDLDLFIWIIWYNMYGSGWSMDLPCWKNSADTLQDEAKIPREILKANAPLRNHHFLTGISHENHLQQGCCQHLKYERVNLCRFGKWSGKRTKKKTLWLWYTCSCLEQPSTSGSAVTETVESHPDSALESKHDPWIETDDTFQVLRVCFNISQPGSRNDCVRWHPKSIFRSPWISKVSEALCLCNAFHTQFIALSCNYAARHSSYAAKWFCNHWWPGTCEGFHAIQRFPQDFLEIGVWKPYMMHDLEQPMSHNHITMVGKNRTVKNKCHGTYNGNCAPVN